MNYETVKAFNNEKLEMTRYEKLLESLKQSALLV
jgi:ABC-type transport system involved in Fe-S cluster assembly fused permease/ATPase subunit